jgi:hypothetical protein
VFVCCYGVCTTLVDVSVVCQVAVTAETVAGAATAVDDEAEREAELAGLAAAIAKVETETRTLTIETQSQVSQIRQVRRTGLVVM